MDQFAVLPADGAKAQALLRRYLAEELTAICLVLGTGQAADECWTKAQKQASDQSARVVRVPKLSVLSATQLKAWRPTATVIATFLTPDSPRKVSATLSPPEATSGASLYSAFVDALAGGAT